MASGLSASNASLPEAGAAWDELARHFARQLGWRITPQRCRELCEGESGGGLAALQRWSQPLSQADVQALAERFAVGETYFFRDAAAFERIECEVLPALTVGGAGRLRLWSAGCCSGEEAYSLALVVERVLAQRAGWDAEILATDIHPGFLQRARDGLYGDWSFRGVAPGLREQHFERREDGRWAVPAALKRRLRFGHLNLAGEDELPSACDLILCRHVLMYFEPAQARRTIARLHRALRPGGWLLVGPAEAQSDLFDGFEALRRGDTVLYRKPEPAVERRPAPRAMPAPVPAAPERLHREARLAAAIRRCEHALAADKCDPSLHYLHALLLEQARQPALARAALRRVLFLDRRFVPAHLALVRLCEEEGRRELALRHRGHADQLQQELAP